MQWRARTILSLLLGCSLCGCSQWDLARGYYKGYTDDDMGILTRDFDVQYTAAHPGLIVLNPNRPYNDDRFRRALPYMKKSGVTELYLGCHPFTDAVIPLVVELGDLRVLDVSNTEITTDGLTTLRSMRHLKNLYVSRPRSEGDLKQLSAAIPHVTIQVTQVE